jgi:hypothetical protein
MSTRMEVQQLVLKIVNVQMHVPCPLVLIILISSCAASESRLLRQRSELSAGVSGSGLKSKLKISSWT